MKKSTYPMIKLDDGRVVCRFCGAERKHRDDCKYIVRIAVMGSEHYSQLSEEEKLKIMDEINSLPTKFDVKVSDS